VSRLLDPPLPPTPPLLRNETPFYGWRYLRRRDAEGREFLEEVPLTLEDVLYPQEGDEIPMRPQHQIECSYLANVFRNRYAHDPSVAVLSDCLIDWGMAGQRNHEPDLAVFRDVQIPPDPQAGTFDLRASGGRVVLTVEVVSPDTRVNDVERKPVDYHRLGIPLYVLIDQQRKHGPRQLHGYRWTPSGYEELALNAEGRLMLAPVGLQLALEDGWLACYDAATGERLGDYQEIAEALQEERMARQAAEEGQRQEAAARQAAEERQRQEIAARQAAEERQRQEAAARQAAEERQRQEIAARQAAEERQRQEIAARQAAEERVAAESARAQAAEERLRQMEAELRRLRGES
jgi:colicin import membrane protein